MDTPSKITQWIGTPASIMIHTLLFIAIFLLWFFGFSVEEILLLLTTAVSLEAIYLSLFIQMTINKNTQSLQTVVEDIDEIQQVVEEVNSDIDEVHQKIQNLDTDVEDISKDIESLHLDEDDNDEDMLKLQSKLNNIMSELTTLKTQLVETRSKRSQT